MSEPLARREDDMLGRELTALSQRIAFPPTPDLAPAIAARIAAGHARTSRSRRQWPRQHPYLLGAVALIVLCLVATLASSTVRQAAADALGVAGIRIEWIEPTPTALPSPAGATIGLGIRTSLIDAAANAGFTLLELDPAVFGPPDDVYLRPLASGGALVTFVYAPDAHLPQTAETGAGLLLMQFVSQDDLALFIKGVMGDGIVRMVSFDGATGYWVEGTSQLTILDDPSAPACCASRPSANVLIWERDGVTYRLETSLSLDEAMSIARAMVQIPPSTREP